MYVVNYKIVAILDTRINILLYFLLRVYNVDETGFTLGEVEGPVLAAKGEKHIHKVCFMMI